MEQSKCNTALWGMLILALMACMFETYVGLRGAAQPGKVDRIWTFSFVMLASYWAMQDAQVRRLGRPYTSGFFMFWLWPVMLPAYLIKTRGDRGVLLALAGFVVCVLPELCWLLAGSAS